MQKIIYPRLLPERTLEIDILNDFRDYPRDMLDVFTEDLSEGIVKGLVPTVDKEIITFSKGIVKHGGKVYVLGEPISLTYDETDVDVAIKLNFIEETIDKDYITTYIGIEIDEDVRCNDKQIELGRFKLKKGAYLRSDYQNLDDFTTEYNTINLIHVLFSGFQKPTISNLLLKYFAKEALEVKTQNPMDISFCCHCLNTDKIERDLIYNYIFYRLEEDINEMDNNTMHRKLVQILNLIKREFTGVKARRTADRRIIVD